MLNIVHTMVSHAGQGFNLKQVRGSMVRAIVRAPWRSGLRLSGGVLREHGGTPLVLRKASEKCVSTLSTV